MRDSRFVRQSGFTIVAAIFLLVVLSGLAAFMVTFSTVQHLTSAQDIQGSRANQAAHAGIEWGLYQVLVAGGGSACPAGSFPALPGDLAGFNVVVSCTKTTYVEAGNSVPTFLITSTASSGVAGSASYVERQLQVRV